MAVPHEKAFADYEVNGDVWITLATGEYYPDILPDACLLYKPVLITFGGLLKSAHSSRDLYMAIMDQSVWMRTQLCRVFRKYVSPETPVEMLKKKNSAKETCDRFGKGFRAVTIVQERFKSRPMPDEALCAVLWEYRDRGQKGYDLTERFFAIMREHFPLLEIIGPERAGKDVLLGELFDDYPNRKRPVDFVLSSEGEYVAVGLARYDSDRGGSQEDDRTGQYRDCANEVLNYVERSGIPLKVIFLNDGPGLLLGSMWQDYASIEESHPGLIKVVTLRMIEERITMEWLLRDRK